MVSDEIKSSAIAVASELVKQNAAEVKAVGAEILGKVIQPIMSVVVGAAGVAGAAFPVLIFAAPLGAFSLGIFSACSVHVLKDIKEGKELLLEIFGSRSPTPTTPSPTPSPSPSPTLSQSPTPSPSPSPTPSPSPSPSPCPIASPSPSPKAPMLNALHPKLFVVAGIAAASIWGLGRLLKPRTPPIFIVEVKNSFFDSFNIEINGLPPLTTIGERFFEYNGVVIMNLNASQADREEKTTELQNAPLLKPDQYVNPNGEINQLYLLTEIFLCTRLSLHFGLAITVEDKRFVLYGSGEALPGAQPNNAAERLQQEHSCGRAGHVFLSSDHLQ